MDQLHQIQEGGDRMSNDMRKALIFELDGTAISKKPRAKPSKRVLEAIQLAHTYAVVIFATARDWKSARDYAKLLGITAPCVTLAGAQVVDPLSNKVIWEQDLDPGVPSRILSIAKEHNAKIYDYNAGKYVSTKNYKVRSVEPILVLEVTDEQAPELLKQIKKTPLLSVEMVRSDRKSNSIITVKHIHATKFMALQTIAKKLKIDPKQSIGVGDAASDITLLNFCGIKIAMGSATSRLKELAQHIAPPIEEDGLAWVIDTFVRSS